MSAKTGRPVPQQKQKQKYNQGQNRGGQTSQQPRPQTQGQAQTQTQTPKASQQSAVDVQAARQNRINRQAEARAAADKRRRMKSLRRNGIIAAIALGLIALFAFLYIREATKPGQEVAAMASRQHLDPGVSSSIPYNSDPPTNGPHSEKLPEFKVYTEPITKELTVHGLEDGGVVINYKPDLDKTSVDKLASIATSYISQRGGKGNVILAPYPNLSNPIVLTAWRRIDRIDTLDEARIRRFIDEYVGINHHEGAEGKRLP